MGIADRTARRLGYIARSIRLGSRAFGFVDTNPVPPDWHHVTKVDPEEEKKLPLLFPLYLQHSSAVTVGGSRDVNSRNTEETFELMSLTDVPVIHEPSAPTHVTDRTREMSDLLTIPEVLNGDVDALIGKLGEGIEYIQETLAPELIEQKFPWLPPRFVRTLADFATGWMLEDAVFEAYIIQNPDSAAAREAGVEQKDLLSPGDAAQRALAAEKHLGSEVIYLEYSGTYGGEEAMAILEAIDAAVNWPRIWYGGGLVNRKDTERVLSAGADAVIVGNVFHEIAEEEREISALATETLSGSPTIECVDDWFDDAVDIEDTAAAHYLSTVPNLDDPVSLARSYLGMSAFVSLAINHEIGSISDESREANTESLLNRIDSKVSWVISDVNCQSIIHEYAATQLERNFGTQTNPEIPVWNLSLYH